MNKKNWNITGRVADRVAGRDNLILLLFFSIIILFGGMNNLFALVSNDGKMPVYYPSYLKIGIKNFSSPASHFFFTNFSEVRKGIHSDIIPIYKIGVISIGDCLIILGYFGIFAALIIKMINVFKTKIIIKKHP